VTALDATHPGATVHAFDAPVRAGVSPGNQAAEVEQVELQRVTFKSGAGEIWLTVREKGDAHLARPIRRNPTRMRVEVTGAVRAAEWGAVSFTQES